MANVKKETIEQLTDLRKTIEERLVSVIKDSEKDLVIDDNDLDNTLVRIPRLQSKYLSMYSNEIMFLKDLYAMKEKVKLERWKYWNGKQSDKYYNDNGIVHEKILKSDIDKYMTADEKMILVNSVVAAQKTLVDCIESVSKEIGNIGFHIKSIIEWRKFVSGV